MVPLVAVTAAVMMLIGRRRAALLVLIAPAAASALTEWVLKPLVQRVFLSARTHGLAFPSGHSTATFSLAFAIAAVALAHRHPRRPTGGQWAIAMAAVGVAVSVALALVIARWHYPTDTVGGALVALCTVIAVALGIDTALRAHPAARGIRGQ